MSGSVIVAGARTPIGRLLGGLKSLSAAELGGVAIKGALDKAGVSGDQVDYLIMGQVILAGAGQNPARTAGIHAGLPLLAAVDHDQQGLPLRPERDRHGRPADPRRRGRDHRRRRHGVDDQRAPPAAEVARGLQVRRRHAGRLDGLRRPVGPDHRAGDGRPDRGLQRRPHQPDPRGAGRLRRRLAPEGRRRPGRTASSTTRSCRSRSRSARATRSSSPRTRASAATPRSSRCPRCARRSARTARSPPAPPRRSPTAPPRWS